MDSEEKRDLRKSFGRKAGSSEESNRFAAFNASIVVGIGFLKPKVDLFFPRSFLDAPKWIKVGLTPISNASLCPFHKREATTKLTVIVDVLFQLMLFETPELSTVTLLWTIPRGSIPLAAPRRISIGSNS